MPALLQIAQLGHPILRSKAKPVEDIRDDLVQARIDDMVATVMDVDGVGLAAPQVYEPLRIFILASHPNARYPHAPEMTPTAIINPRILSYSQERQKDWEGCLSIPGVRGLVPRAVSIDVEYTTREGKKEQKTVKGFVARVFQHEFDHLEGIVFFDRLETTKDIYMEKEYQKSVSQK